MGFPVIGKQYGRKGKSPQNPKKTLGSVMKNKARQGNLKHTLFHFRPYFSMKTYVVDIHQKHNFSWHG